MRLITDHGNDSRSFRHLSFTAIHELLTASTYVGVGVDEEPERMCQSRMIFDPTGEQ